MADKENNNALDEAQIKKILTNIPNNVSGDGKVFVAALKNYLVKSGLLTNKKIDDSASETGEKPGHVSSVQLLELHSINDGVRVNSIQVSWVKTTVTNYAKAEVWFRTATDKAWEKAGESSGTQFVYSGATTGLTYYIKVVAVNTKGNTADFDTAPQASIKIQGSQYIPNPPTQFVLTWDEKGPLWKWLFEPNEYIDFFELRLDQNPGVWNDKRLDSTRETWSRANPGVRSGTAYLYIRNIFGEYSEPAVHEFSKALPQKPTAPQLTSTIDGVRIKMQGLPLGSTGYKIHIKTKDSTETVEDDFYTVNSEYIYFFFIGHITVKYCFVDPLGDGEWSDTTEADCKAGIDIGQVPTIDYTKFDKFTQDAIDKANNQPSINEDLKNTLKAQGVAIQQNANSITAIVEDVKGNKASIQANADNITSIVTNVDKQGSAIVQNANSITSVVTELNKKPADCNYSSINQLQDDILLCVKKDGVINAINVSTEGIVIDGNKVHITGDTVFDNNVIVGGMIAADTIALEHLKANSVSSAKIQANAITSTKIGAGAVTAEKIEAGAITAEKLAADSVTSDAIQAGSVIGDKIAANTITGKHFAAANIDLTGALTITGGNVKLSQEGLRLTNSDSSYTLFNQEGINYVDANGIVYAQVTKMIIGVAYDGQRVKFNAPWPKVPRIFVSPTSLMVNNADYSQNNIFIVCSATDITNEGFKVNCYSCLGQDTKGLVVINKSVTGYRVSKGENEFMNFTIVVPSSASSITVAGYVHNIPWNSFDPTDDSGLPNKGNGVSNFYAEISGKNVTSCTPFHYGPDKHADKHEWSCDFSVTAKLSGATQVTFRAYGTHTDTNNYNVAYNNGGGLSMSVPSATLDVDGDVVVSRGYANFMVVDNASSTYTLETKE